MCRVWELVRYLVEGMARLWRNDPAPAFSLLVPYMTHCEGGANANYRPLCLLFYASLSGCCCGLKNFLRHLLQLALITRRHADP